MKTKFKQSLSVVIIAMVLIVSGCNNNAKKTNAETHKNHNEMVQYTCSMHPEIITSESGDCPKCGMALIEKKEDNHEDHTHEGHNH